MTLKPGNPVSGSGDRAQAAPQWLEDLTQELRRRALSALIKAMGEQDEDYTDSGLWRKRRGQLYKMLIADLEARL